MEIKDAVAVVTGGASGLGLATTKRLLDAGAQVVVLDLRGEEAVRELGDRARFAQADVTDEAAVAGALDTAESMGPLRIVVNCAGTGNAIRVLGKDGVFVANRIQAKCASKYEAKPGQLKPGQTAPNINSGKASI